VRIIFYLVKSLGGSPAMPKSSISA